MGRLRYLIQLMKTTSVSQVFSDVSHHDNTMFDLTILITLETENPLDGSLIHQIDYGVCKIDCRHIPPNVDSSPITC